MANINSTKKKSPMIKYGMTPKTSALYAFAESPGRAADGMNNLQSRR